MRIDNLNRKIFVGGDKEPLPAGIRMACDLANMKVGMSINDLHPEVGVTGYHLYPAMQGNALALAVANRHRGHQQHTGGDDRQQAN